MAARYPICLLGTLLGLAASAVTKDVAPTKVRPPPPAVAAPRAPKAAPPPAYSPASAKPASSPSSARPASSPSSAKPAYSPSSARPGRAARPPASVAPAASIAPAPRSPLRLSTPWLLFTPSLSSFRLKVDDRANGGSATFDSGLNLGLCVRASLYSGYTYSIVLEGGVSRLTLKAPAGTRFDADSGMVWDARLGIHAQPFSPDFEVEALAGLRRLLVIRAADTNGNFSFSRVTVPEVRAGAGWLFAELGQMELGIAGRGNLLFPASHSQYGVEDGVTLAAELFGRVETIPGRFQAGLELSTTSLRTTPAGSDTVTSSQTRTELKLLLGLGFR